VTRWAMLLILGTGCATVKPYERELLADEMMTLEADGEADAATDHALDYREGGAALDGAEGGGCGCN